METDRVDETAAPGPSGFSAPVSDSVPRWGLGAFLLVGLVYLLASAAFVVVLAGRGPLSAGMLALAVGAPTVIAAGLAVLITTLRGNGPRTDLKLHWSWHGVGLGLLFGFGGLLVTVPASVLYASVAGPGAKSAVASVFSGVQASWPWAVAVFALVVFVGPLGEEIIFRGLLWGAVDRRWGRWAALVVTTVVFALAHLEFTRAPLLVVVAIPIALARLYSGGLLASIVAHQVTNLLPGIILMLGVAGVMPMP
ncbi:membrane protein [Mycobacterium gastri 'Wayne']|nr:membrane protein [Mycobacterium gastri 'Wayne']